MHFSTLADNNESLIDFNLLLCFKLFSNRLAFHDRQPYPERLDNEAVRQNPIF
jgi:hypothetical protein